MTVYEILEQIANTSGTNDKIALLEKHKDNAELVALISLELDPNINFHMRKVPEPAMGMPRNEMVTYDDMFNFLDRLSNREISGNAALHEAATMRASMSEEMDSIFVRVLKKDLRTGMGSKNVNKAFGKDFVKETPYMRCSLTTSKTLSKFKWLKADKTPNVASEVKMDGQYLNHIVRNGQYSAESRNGKAYDFMGVMDSDFARLAEILNKKGIKDPVFNGEGVVGDGNGGVLPRTTGNGIIQKFGKGTGNILDAQNIIAVLWDVIPYENYREGEWKVERHERRRLLEEALAELGSERIRMVEYKMVSSFEEAYEYNTKMMARGEEGTIIKDDRGPWKAHTSPWQLKMKLKFEIDLKVVGFEEGTAGKKNQNSLGALIIESACGKLRCKVGTGFKEKFDKKYSDDMVRQYIWDNRDGLLGKIVTVEANDIVQDKKGNQTLKLFLPVFVEWRHDKDQYDDLTRIDEMKQAAILALLGK